MGGPPNMAVIMYLPIVGHVTDANMAVIMYRPIVAPVTDANMDAC